MHKIAITIRQKEDQFTYFFNETYYQFLSPYFEIELVLPRKNHLYHDIVQRNDALLICGGNDIDPYYYHEEPHPLTTCDASLIEAMDFALLEQFYHAHKKIFGICRGIQVINVFFKGSLIQDIPTQFPTSINHSQDFHRVTIQPHCFLTSYFPQTMLVNSFHHQNIKTPSPLFHINALSKDNLIEGIENHQIIAVQWHPERMDLKHQQQFTQMMIDFIQKKNFLNKEEA